MTDQSDTQYSVRRHAQERAAADRATDPAVRGIHAQLADRHADAIWSEREARCAADDRC